MTASLPSAWRLLAVIMITVIAAQHIITREINDSTEADIESLFMIKAKVFGNLMYMLLTNYLFI